MWYVPSRNTGPSPAVLESRQANLRAHKQSPVDKLPYELTSFSPRECFHALKTPIRFLKGVGPARGALFESVGLKTVEDLLYHLPFRYEDRREIKKINQAIIGAEDTFMGKLIALDKRYVPRWRRQILTGRLADGTGSLQLIWFHPKPYITERLSSHGNFLVHGKVEGGRGSEKRIVHPQFDPMEDGENKEVERILPVYLRLGGIPLGTIRKLVPQALAKYRDFLPSFLPLTVARRHRVTNLKEALTEIHQPQKDSDLASLDSFRSSAHRSIIFDEFFYLQLGLALQRKHRTVIQGISFSKEREKLSAQMQRLIPFELTAAQHRVLEEIHQDMAAPRPMQRLMQGDVGSGKTIVAWLAAVRAVENGFQAAMMAPTELLAHQHFNHLKVFADQLNIPAGLLIGSLPAGEKKALTQRIAEGEIRFVVGTHALIQAGVSIPQLGLSIIDEQHRFGVVQRSVMKRLSHWKSSTAFSLPQPDILLMSATPIPRSLAMVLYGDMEVSSLDEMPPGRMPVTTKVFKETQRAEVYQLIREEIRRGHQAYIVYPLVEESEQLPLKDATGMAK
ncbi:MAG: DEAD/DEAH box helicase, partial [Deltaproteobacteria bacterium]|nr:DEAD/DEAH box helicase [Deltaproteobacteria bacterium]